MKSIDNESTNEAMATRMVSKAYRLVGEAAALARKAMDYGDGGFALEGIRKGIAAIDDRSPEAKKLKRAELRRLIADRGGTGKELVDFLDKYGADNEDGGIVAAVLEDDSAASSVEEETQVEEIDLLWRDVDLLSVQSCGMRQELADLRAAVEGLQRTAGA